MHTQLYERGDELLVGDRQQFAVIRVIVEPRNRTNALRWDWQQNKRTSCTETPQGFPKRKNSKEKTLLIRQLEESLRLETSEVGTSVSLP